MAQRLAGKPPAQAVRERVKRDVALEREKSGRVPGLAVVQVGDDPASSIYVKRKHEAALALGIQSFEHRPSAAISTEALLELVDRLNDDAAVHGILVQMPLPPHLDARSLVERINPAKDVDGLTRVSQGALMRNQPGLRPCTAIGIMDLLSFYEVPISGRRAVVVGRSALVGLPVAVMLMQQNATVTIVHSRTVEPAPIAAQADLLVVAAGQPALVTADWIKKGAVVVDVGINRREGGLAGDVDAAAEARARAFTPVPGGVGPMTIAELMRNTWLAFSHQVHGQYE